MIQFRHLLPPLLLLIALLAGCGGGGSSPPASTVPPLVTPPASDGSFTDANRYSSLATASLASPNEQHAIVDGQLTLSGKVLNYKATTGHLTATDARTARAVTFFYVAYTLPGQDTAKRPVTFFYNGGPGSSTLWLHLGAFGPKRLVTNIPATTMPSPPQLLDNAESLLDVSDLVFIDAVGTGFSQAIAPGANRDYWGVDSDAGAFRDFVQRYIAVNARQASPKFLFGESYGAPRTGVLANLLEVAGVKIDGLVLQSSIMDYNSNCGVLGPSVSSCEGYFPTFATTSAYLKLITPARDDLPAYAQAMRGFSATSYRGAIVPWLANRTPPPTDLLALLGDYTGIPSATWQLNFNMGPGIYQHRVLPGQITGRYDARVTATVGSALAADDDPSLTVINASFVNTIGSYISGTLKYNAGTSYTAFADIVDSWDFRHDSRQVPDTIPDLAGALLHNPAMKVLAMSGYHDLATPFYQTELDLARLGSANIVIKNYSSGHMSYLDNTARRQQRLDLGAFYQSVTGTP